MTCVHEPGSRIMSKNRLRNNTESNQIENRPSAQPVTNLRAPPARPARLACRCRSPSPRARLSPERPARAPARPARLLLPAPRAPRAPLARPECSHARLLRPAPCHDTAACLATQAALSLATAPHNTICIAIQTCCPLNFIAIHF